MLLAGLLILGLLATSSLDPAIAQMAPAPGEAPEIPAFDMFDLDSLDKDAIALPEVDAIGVPELESLEVVEPETDTDDPCRHFTLEERRRLPTLCSTSN